MAEPNNTHHGASDQERLLALVSRVSALGALKLPLDGLLRETARTAQALTEATGAVVAILEGDQLIYRASSGSLERHAGLALPARSSLSGLALAERELVYSGDTDGDSRVNLELVRQTGARSMVVAPLLHGTAAVGVLKMVSDRPHAFDTIDEHATQLCAQFVAGAVARQFVLDENERLLAHQHRTMTRARTVLEASPAATIVHDLEGRIEMWNPAAEALLGWSEQEVVGKTPPYVPPEEMGVFLDITRQLAAGTLGRYGPLPRVRKDGASMRIWVSGAPLKDEHGQVFGVVRVLEEHRGP